MSASTSTLPEGSSHSVHSGRPNLPSLDSYNKRTLNFFRNIASRKSSDYHDAPPVSSVRSSRGTSSGAQSSLGASHATRSSLGTSLGTISESQKQQAVDLDNSVHSRPPLPELPPRSCWERLKDLEPCTLTQVRIYKMQKILSGRLWKLGVVVFTALLLFGFPIQLLFLPKLCDSVLDVLYLVAFLFFWADILMRICIEPLYFGISRQPSGCWYLGSFVFWCDVVSTLTLLYSISFVNRNLFDVHSMTLYMDTHGTPTGDDLDSYNRPIPFRPELMSVVTIAKTCRIARFIRHPSLRASGKINWYHPLQYLKVPYLRDRFNCQTHSSRGAMDRKSRDESSPSPEHDRRQSWTFVQLGIIAAIRIQEAKDREHEEDRKRGPIARACRKVLKTIGVIPDSMEDIKREVAATRIQRKWRATVLANQLADVANDVAWEGRQSASNAFEQELRQRSARVKFSRVNQGNLRYGSLSSRRGSSSVTLSRQKSQRRKNESQVGSAMRELTGQRVAMGIVMCLLLTVACIYHEHDATEPMTMVVLHQQTAISQEFAQTAVTVARDTSVPKLFQYQLADGNVMTFTDVPNVDKLRDTETLVITVTSETGGSTSGTFSYRDEIRNAALAELLSTFFILLIWFFGITAFSGPVKTLVVIPIERMVQLLNMLMLDPLGYEGTSRYKKFVAKENELTRNTKWTKEVLKGMETSFLMSTILRIGSLMKVGFGSAGVEIIRNNLERGQDSNMLVLNLKGKMVSCIFLFCDIRQFTAATEALQEEVFLFTNRIAAVVHSICHSYGGSANKNVGDAFLLSWLLDEDSKDRKTIRASRKGKTNSFMAKNNQADKALLTVVKICMALHHDNYYLEKMSQGARDALMRKIGDRKGPIVQMGFGLHAGKAVQGAIGSQRKIDATYVSEAVERAEFLESSTKKFGLKLLMSDYFHRLLHPSTRRRCRKVDQILIRTGGEEKSDKEVMDSDIMELLTFDMDIDALWRIPKKKTPSQADAIDSDAESIGSKREKSSRRGGGLAKSRRLSMSRLVRSEGSEELSKPPVTPQGDTPAQSPTAVEDPTESGDGNLYEVPQLHLPTGPALYSSGVWLSDDIRRIRELYTDGIFFHKFNSGLQAFYSGKDWDLAKNCFQTILNRFEDGPSRYFLNQIEKHKGVPPPDFPGYGTI